MAMKLHALVYVILVLINSFIGFLATYSMGQSEQVNAEEEKIM